MYVEQSRVIERGASKARFYGPGLFPLKDKHAHSAELDRKTGRYHPWIFDLAELRPAAHMKLPQNGTVF